MPVLPHPLAQPTMSIDEAAEAMGMGRSTAYAAAQEYLRTGGNSGLPVIRVGEKRLRVPTAALWRLVGLDVEPLEPASA